MQSRVYPLSTAIVAVLATLLPIASIADTFGSGTNNFTLDFVNVSNPGNTADTTTYGAVPYQFRMGRYEIPQDAIDKATAGGLMNVTAGAWSQNKPACFVSWYEAAAFVNWLNTSTGHQAAYNLVFTNGAWSMQLWDSGSAWTLGGTNLFRHKNARYFLPTENEWYKAAYYNAAGANYFLYPTASSTLPTKVASGTSAGTAVYDSSTNSPAAVQSAGGLGPYGTMAQGGNVYEWLESAADGTNNLSAENRMLRGGHFFSPEANLRSSGRTPMPPTNDADYFGIRVASTLPMLTATPSSLSGFSTTLGTASAAQNFDVGGSSLSGVITITAPTGYEISLSLGSGYANSLTLTPSSSAVASTQIFVRLTGVSTGSPADNVTVASTGAITQNVALSGIVTTPTPTPTPSPSDTDADGANDYREVADGTDPNDPNSFNSLSKGLVAYYPFDGNANDESGMGNHASGFNVDYVTDPSSDAPRQVVTLGESSYLATALFSGSKPSSGTIVCYLKYYGYSDGYGSSIWNASSGCNDFALLFSGSKPVIWAKENDCSSLPEDVGFADVNRSRYESYIVTWSSAGTTAYHNGIFVGQSSNQFRTGSSSPLGIGNSFYQTSASNYFAGSIDEFRVYDRALSDAEIKRLYYLQAFSDFQRAFLAVSPGVMGHFSQSEYNSNRTNGQIDVTSNPSAFNLFTADQFSANYSNGVSAGMGVVLSNPGSYNLYTSNSIMDLAIGALMIQKQGTNATVVFQPQSTTDLATLPFTNNGTPITNTIPMPGNKGFLRVRGVGGSFPGGVGPGGGAGND